MARVKIALVVDDARANVSSVPRNLVGDRWIPRWKATSGKIAEDVGQSMLVTTQGIHKNALAPPVLTFTDARAIARRLDALNLGSNHLDAKSNATWRTVYQSAMRPIDVMNSAGVVAAVNMETIPCHNCGIIVPMEDVQVDHTMPQAGGEDLYTVKALRALGLTVGASTGSKGLAMTNGVQLAAIDPKGRNRGDYNHLVNPTAGAKWTTNDRGEAFLTMMALGDGIDSLRRACKNSILNLAALCGACNREKSDWIRPIV